VGDTLKKVQPGDPLRIPASTFNTLIDVARDHLANRQNATRQPVLALPPPGVILTIRNDSGSDCGRFEVLGLDEPVFPPEDNTADFSRGPVMSCVYPVDPDHLGAFVVLLEPIAAGAVGRAMVQGAVYVQVQIDDLDKADWADITDGEPGYLTATDSGSARILWYDGEEVGTLWCVCLLGAGGGSGGSTDDSSGSFTAHYSMSRYFTEWPEETPAFWSLGGSLNSFIQIALDVRKCQYDLPTGNHPGCTLAKANQGFAGNCLASWAGDDDTWFDLGYTAHDATGDLIGEGVEAIPYFHIQARVTTAGSLELRTVNDGDSMLSCVIAGAVWRKSHPEAPGTIEFGAGGCHDDTTWGDGVWEPES
jgi:hypothetical protein